MLGLGLGLEPSGFGLEPSGLGLGLRLSGLDYITVYRHQLQCMVQTLHIVRSL